MMNCLLISACVVVAVMVTVKPAASEGWTEWLPANVVDGFPGTWASRRQMSPMPCGDVTPEYVVVQQNLGSSWEIILKATDFITVGPKYGLLCKNAHNGGSYTVATCGDYSVKYHTATGSSPWLNRDDPNQTADSELASAESAANQQWASDSLYIEYKNAADLDVTTDGPAKLDRMVYVGADFGLYCSNAENAALGLGECREYEVQFYCP